MNMTDFANPTVWCVTVHSPSQREGAGGRASGWHNGISPLQSLISSADSLGANTLLLREWVGILWYKILGLKWMQEKG